MKRLIPLLIVVLAFACGKDKSDIDTNCGLILESSQQNDGGIAESIDYSGCGEELQKRIDLYSVTTSTWPLTLFYKGQTRTKAKYLIITKQVGGAEYKGYFRYESGSIPDSTVQHYTAEGWTTIIQELTGLENAIY